jgi:hypothetical protein
MKPLSMIVGAIAIAIVVGGTYIYFPAMARTVDETTASAKESEYADNWEYYYDKEVDKMEASLTEFGQQREETIADSLKLEQESEALKAKVERTNRLLQRVAADYKLAKSEGKEEVEINGRKLSLSSAREQLASWIKERNLKGEELARIDGGVTRMVDIRKREKAAFQKLRAQIVALKREKGHMKANLRVTEIETRMRELESVSSTWTSAHDLSDLEGIKGVIADKLLHSEARRQLLDEETNIDRQVGLDAALRTESADESSSEVSAELEALLGGKDGQ